MAQCSAVAQASFQNAPPRHLAQSGTERTKIIRGHVTPPMSPREAPVVSPHHVFSRFQIVAKSKKRKKAKIT
jgi:hypothetical protein